MKKNILVFSALLLLSTSSMAKLVSEQQAAQVGAAFLSMNAPASVKGTTPLSRIYGAVSTTGAQQPLYYVFQNTGNVGFVIVAADDQVLPVLGYSTDNTFQTNNIRPSVKSWLDNYGAQIQYVRDQNVPATLDIQQKWAAYTQYVPGTSRTANRSTAVSSFVMTRWNQDPYYNADCPWDASANDRAVTGCVATAMAQIMRYWNYPAVGTGSHSYMSANYGTQTANFSATTYQWSAMPNSISGPNAAIATLMYHCGVSVEMNYDVSANGGSGAQVLAFGGGSYPCTENALVSYFGYKNSIQGIERDSYTDPQWMSIIKSEMDIAHPVLYTGFGGGSGHAFVFDGYDANDFFHINWGWGGYYDGLFVVDALNPGTGGTGSGSGTFNDGQQALIGIEPQSLPMPDMYEANNKLSQAYTLNVPFVSDSAVVSTTNANFHINSDSDFYKIVLPAGYNYAITPRLQDANNSNNGGTYTVNAQFQYSVNNGVTWSYPYDYMMLGSIPVTNGGTVYFRATPRTLGLLGTYQLDMKMSRTSNGNPTAVEDIQDAEGIAIYPNPAKETATVDLSGYNGKIGAIVLKNMQGQNLGTTTVDGTQKQVALSLRGLAEGIYLMQLQGDNGTLTRKLVVRP